MSEELRKYVEDALYKWIRKQIEEGNFKANLRIEIDSPIEVKGMKGRVVGEIILSEQIPDRLSSIPSEYPKKAGEESAVAGSGEQKKDGKAQSSEEMSLSDVDKLLRSLGV
jgi:hypothetical protein